MEHKVDVLSYFCIVHRIWHWRHVENCPQLRIEVLLSAFQTETLTLTFSPMRAVVMTHTLAKGQGHLFQTLEWKLKMDGGICITSRANAVGKYGSLI